MDNLKDYTVRALVNAVDHLGTVAYKLTDLLEQQSSELSTTELKVTCLNQVWSVAPDASFPFPYASFSFFSLFLLELITFCH